MENQPRKELVVSAIENGTVLDHIPAKSVFHVMKILDLDNIENQVLIGTNLDSKKFGKKGIIKVRDKFFKNKEVNKIAIIAPSATLIEIKKYKVTYKKQVKTPTEISGSVKCVNPNCITNHENIISKFTVIKNPDGEIKLECRYCEKMTGKKNMEFI
ncbi:MAG: aspartate carbamoyltransferase regulatory subunit [Bacteroidales bacterium]|nr:aspartate carbamoyltransferase regulatory subunit [Bacteroidales bacterium]